MWNQKILEPKIKKKKKSGTKNPKKKKKKKKNLGENSKGKILGGKILGENYSWGKFFDLGEKH